MQSVKNATNTWAQSTFNYTCSPITQALYIECPIDNPGQINWCQIWPRNTQGSRFSQLALCIQWLLRQKIKLRRENNIWNLKTCGGKRNVDLQMSTYTE